MKLTFSKIYSDWNNIFKESQIDLDNIAFTDPWGMAILCLKSIELVSTNNKQIIFPKDKDVLYYLKRVHFDEFLKDIGLTEAANQLNKINMPEKDNLNVYEIYHSDTRDEFGARLTRCLRMFENFGLNTEQAQFATAIIGELGNNVFDHNAFNWPTNISGAIICGQGYPKFKKIEIAIADPGIGFKKSLNNRKPNLKNEIEAIKLGLSGVSGWIDAKRGNGLKLVQDWTLNQFSGILRIQSGNGLVTVAKTGIKGYKTNKILGTIAEFVIKYH